MLNSFSSHFHVYVKNNYFFPACREKWNQESQRGMEEQEAHKTEGSVHQD